MRYCTKCGQQLLDGARFCRACGAAVPTRQAAPAQPAPTQPAPAKQSTSPPSVPPPPAPPKKAAAPKEARPAQARKQANAGKTNARVAVAPLAAQPEEVAPPPPTTRGITVSWNRDSKGTVRLVPARTGAGTATARPPARQRGGVEGAPTPSAGPAAPSTASPGDLFGATQPVTLPPAPAGWAFRRQTSALAERAVASFSKSSVASAHGPVAAVGVRLIQGALLHRQVYREAAEQPARNTEALWVAAGILAVGAIGPVLTSFASPYYSFSIGFALHVALLRVIGWACSVFAVQMAAKALYTVSIPPAAWFRALIFAQAATLLAILPAISLIAGLWAAVCTVAAIQDLTGRDTVAAIILTVIGGVAASLGAGLATSFLPM
jgi:hypothetical protein